MQRPIGFEKSKEIKLRRKKKLRLRTQRKEMSGKRKGSTR